MTTNTNSRWESLDILRGLSIIGMLLNLNPGAWEHEYSWLVHAKWEGGTLIDMVAPSFLFCIGASIPLSSQNRIKKGFSKAAIAKHILLRSLLLVVIGVFLNAYPVFDWAHVRGPGVLQRIGLCFGLVGLFTLFTSRQNGNSLSFSPKLITATALFILISYWILLYFIPVPGFGAPRFDPVGSWPSYIDRAVFGIDHMFTYWPVDGKVVFDPDGLVSVYPVCATVLLGVLTGVAYHQNRLKRPALTAFLTGVAFIVAALLLHGICPIIKNIWTSTFVLFSGGFSLVVLSGITVLLKRANAGPVFFPAKVYGANPMLAYLLCWLLMPLLDWAWIPTANGFTNIRYGSHAFLRTFTNDRFASFLFSIVYLSLIFGILLICYRKRWILKL
ncbi:acyltransferase family protein [Flavobacterium sp. RHBU_24]|uniref:acyltransferase family protein n=1 Tax=Flavobacterium sp. RHBU_24 TaxID=3391185 RepID=UPI0039848265